MATRVPWALEQLVDRYRSDTIDKNPSYPWLKSSFEKHLPRYREFVVGLPDRIGRPDIIDRCARIVDEASATKAFITTMA